MTKTRHQIISDMCYTVRHDYGLDKYPSNPCTGMTDDERRALYDQMAQVYDHHIEPLVTKLNELQNEREAK